jgi:periplasmic divalent cation tolerance protein
LTPATSPETAVLVISTAPTLEAADRMAEILVAEGLAACVSRLPGLESRFRWRGKATKAEEVLLLAKTRAGLAPRLVERLAELHPYEVPEILVVPVSLGHAPYLAWIMEATQDGRP